MNPWIRYGAIVVGVLMVVGAGVLSAAIRAASAARDESPTWVRRYTLIAFGTMLIVGGVTVDARWAVLSFVVVLFGLTIVKLVSNIRAGGYGGEE